METVWRLRQSVVVLAALAFLLAVFLATRPQRVYLALTPTGGLEQSWPIVATTLAPEDGAHEIVVGPFVRREAKGEVEVDGPRGSLVYPAPADWVGTSVHREGRHYAIIDWAQAREKEPVAQHIAVVEVSPPAPWRSRVPSVALIGTGLLALVAAIVALRRARPWHAGLATWEEGMARGGLVTDDLSVAGAPDGPVLFRRPGPKKPLDPYRSHERIAVEFVAGTRATVREGFAANARLATFCAGFALVPFGASMLLSRASAPPAIAEDPPLTIANPIFGPKRGGFDVGVRAPLPCGERSAVFYETLSFPTGRGGGTPELALRETLVNASATTCHVANDRVTIDGTDRGYLDRADLAPFETRVRTQLLYVGSSARLVTLRTGTPAALTLDLWRRRPFLRPGLDRAAPPPPVLAPARSGAVPEPRLPLAWRRFHVDRRFPSVAMSTGCTTLSDLVVDDAFVATETSESGAVWLSVDVAFRRATGGPCGSPSPPALVVRSQDERRVGDAWNVHEPTVEARDTYRWAFVPGTRKIDLALGAADGLTIDLVTGETSASGTAYELARTGDRRPYVARRLLLALPSPSRPVAAQIEASGAVRLLCQGGGRAHYDGMENTMDATPARMLVDEACR